MDMDKLLSLGMRASIFLMVLATGMAGERGEAMLLLRQPALLLRSMLSMQLLAPLLAVALASTLPLEPAVKIALVTLAVSPVPPFLPSRQLKAGGSRAYVVSLLATSALLSIVTIPATLSVLSDVFGLSLSLPATALLKQLMGTVLLPLVLGLAIARVVPGFTSEWAGAIGSAATLVLVLAALPMLVKLFPGFRTLVGDGTLLVMAAYAVGTLLIGHVLGGPDHANRTALALSTAARHPGIAILLATTNFPDDRLATPAVLLVVIVVFVVTGPYLAITRRRHVAPLAVSTHH